MSCPNCGNENIEKVKIGFQARPYKWYCDNCGWFFDNPGPDPRFEPLEGEDW